MSHTSSKLARVLVHAAFFSVAFVAIPFTAALAAQSGEGGAAKEMLQQKLAAIKASSAENQKKLHQYTWTETSSITVNGREQPPKVSNCFYGPDGKVHKEPVDGTGNATASRGRGHPLMQRVMEKKKAETTDYMKQVGGVIKLYMPPDPEKMGEAFKARKVSFDHNGNQADLVFKNYALSGDSMTIDFDTASKKIRSIHVKTYLDTPQDAVTLTVDFATLPDGTNHASRTTLDAQGKDIHVVNSNSNYRKSSQS